MAAISVLSGWQSNTGNDEMSWSPFFEKTLRAVGAGTMPIAHSDRLAHQHLGGTSWGHVIFQGELMRRVKCLAPGDVVKSQGITSHSN